ncbi:sensor domain-containing diguanylate cyclase [Pleomorphomonas oryzae]|uniref:sensor domain-containing diguanylate cyclase n=1 Tax=Pleomorphomonas oryzae TaxID=261934 RepID=UPI0003FFEC74|nr:sensor domain-containing diguanylate cyclase [Pleomorphomonas oryzae]
MAKRPLLGSESDPKLLLAEIARQNKVIEALMNRLERNAAGDYRTEFDELQTAVALKGEVRRRTAALETALRDNELITRKLRESEFKLLGVVNQPLVGISTSEEGRFTFANKKMADMFGYDVSEVIGRDVLTLVAECDRPMVAEHTRQRMSGEVPMADYTFRGLRKDGVEIDIELHGSVHNVGVRPVAVSIMLDISKRRQAERRAEGLHALLREQSLRDALTGLYNRRYLDVALEEECNRAQRDGHAFSVVMCDLDHFKLVNDRYGHQAGDDVLAIIAAVIDKRCGSAAQAFRYGGEEFLALLPGQTGAAAAGWANALRKELQTQIVNPGRDAFRITASFGVASFPEHGLCGNDLIGLADQALYQAKRGGRNQVRIADLSNGRASALQEPPLPMTAQGRR